MIGRRSFPFGVGPIFGVELLVLGRVEVRDENDRCETIFLLLMTYVWGPERVLVTVAGC